MVPEVKGCVVLAVPRESRPAEFAQVETELDVQLAGRPEAIHLQCAGWDHVSSAQISLLWRLRHRCAAAGVACALLDPPPGLRSTLEALDLAEFFPTSSGTEDRADEVQADGASRGRRTYSDRFLATREGADSGRQRFLGYLAELDLPELTRFELHSVFYEVVQNILAHSGVQAANSVTISAKREGNQLRITFVDTGKPFDPTSAGKRLDVEAASRRRQTHGFGLVMIHRLVDSVSYERRDGCNVLTVEKKAR